MAIATLQELIEAGCHFGTRTNRWEPKMAPFIHSKRNKIYIIDLRQTLTGLIRAYHFLMQTTAKGQKVLFVGTKRQAADVVKQEAERCNSFFITHRWLGGTLTNLETMRQRVARLIELEALESSGNIHNFSKKMISSLSRERKKIARNFEGLRDMKKLPGAIVIVDPKQEDIALAEAIKLDIPVIAIADTDCNPDPIDFLIPANDDSNRSNELILSKLADAIIQGSKDKNLQAVYAGKEKEAQAAAAKVEDKGIDTPEDFTNVGGFSYGGDD
ncbi:MAG: 30S ribosomal protein S2 [Planctomycetes bacterium]|nr:30S ribosomal protein S2 [Planctomycetota bacterium]